MVSTWGSGVLWEALYMLAVWGAGWEEWAWPFSQWGWLQGAAPTRVSRLLGVACPL